WEKSSCGMGSGAQARPHRTAPRPFWWSPAAGASTGTVQEALACLGTTDMDWYDDGLGARCSGRPSPHTQAMSIVNIASYRFVGLDDLPSLRERIRSAALENRLLGTVLLAPEGINLFLAGTADDIRN